VEIPKAEALAKAEADLARLRLRTGESALNANFTRKEMAVIQENIQRIRNAPGPTIGVRRYKLAGPADASLRQGNLGEGFETNQTFEMPLGDTSRQSPAPLIDEVPLQQQRQAQQQLSQETDAGQQGLDLGAAVPLPPTRPTGRQRATIATLPTVIQKLNATSGRGGRAVLSEAEQIELRQFIDEFGENDNFVGAMDEEYFGDLSLYLGKFSLQEPGTLRDGYIVWNPAKGEFGIHNTLPDRRSIARAEKGVAEGKYGPPTAGAERTLEIFGYEEALTPIGRALPAPTSVDVEDFSEEAILRLPASEQADIRLERARILLDVEKQPGAPPPKFGTEESEIAIARARAQSNKVTEGLAQGVRSRTRAQRRSDAADEVRAAEEDVKSFEAPGIEAATANVPSRRTVGRFVRTKAGRFYMGPNTTSLIGKRLNELTIDELNGLYEEALSGVFSGSPGVSVDGDRLVNALFAEANRRGVKSGGPRGSQFQSAGTEEAQQVFEAAPEVPEALARSEVPITPSAAKGVIHVTVDGVDRPDLAEDVAARLPGGAGTDGPPPPVDLQSYMAPRMPDPPPPPAPPGGPAALGPADVPPLGGRVEEGRFPWETPDRAALELHEAAIINEERRAGLLVEAGGRALSKAGFGRYIRGQWVPRPEDGPAIEKLFDALHHPSEVTAGTRQVPAGLEDIYKTLRSLTDWEEARRLDFDPDMAVVEDYFYRGWKPPADLSTGKKGALVSNPAFRKLRKESTYREMRDAGFEPLSWNPFEQWRISRMQGIRYTQQMQLVEFLKGIGDEFIQPHAGGTIPDGWRVPEVGPAFEGKPFAFIDKETDKAVPGFTSRWITLDRIANSLENAYGKRPSIGKLNIAGASFDPLSVIDWLVFVPKRVKLVGSVFQQVDFLIRSGIGSWAAANNALRTGHPVAAVQHIIGYPGTAVDLIGGFFSPNWRRNLRLSLDDTFPLHKDHPGVTLKSISEAGLNVTDPTFFGRDPLGLDKMIREVIEESIAKKTTLAVPRALRELERLSRQGLFGGTYPAALINDVLKNIGPQMIRTYGKTLNDAQLSRAIAHAANTRFSSLPASQSVVQHRGLRALLTRVFFSLNENEGLLRQMTKTLPVGFQFVKRGVRPTKGNHFSKFWIDNWLGAYTFLITIASVVHFASTGKRLPNDRFSPIALEEWGPLPFGYNTKFAAPTLSTDFARELLGAEQGEGLGKAGIEVMLDIVGQMDTALKVLDPRNFLNSRLSVPNRAFKTQDEAEDFYGRPIDEVGPGGIISRTTQLLQDMFGPIGPGQAAINIAVQRLPELEPFLSAGEERLHDVGQLIQGLGVNLRGERIDDALKRQNPNWDTFSPKKQQRLKDAMILEIYGPQTRRDKERYRDKIWEVFPPTDATKEKFEKKMDKEFPEKRSPQPVQPQPVQRPPVQLSPELEALREEIAREGQPVQRQSVQPQPVKLSPELEALREKIASGR